jgi:uncharacterized membrane protein YdcZ (DUF606 family)
VVSNYSYFWYGGTGNNDGAVATSTFTSPRVLAIDSADNLYVYGSAFTSSSISYTGLRKISSAGVVSSIRDVTTSGGLVAAGNSGYGIAVDSTTSTLYVAQSGSIMRGVPVPTLTSANSVTLEKDVVYGASSPAYTAVFASGSGVTGLGTYTATTLPAGLTFDAATQQITGTPTATGTTTVTLGATDSYGTGTNTLTIIVATKPGVPTLSSTTASATQVSVAFSAGTTGGSAITGYTVTASPVGGVPARACCIGAAIVFLIDTFGARDGSMSSSITDLRIFGAPPHWNGFAAVGGV